MDDVTRHPEDAELFDHVEGTLDAGRASIVERHLARCAACAAFVAAARAGRDGAVMALVELPADRAEQMHAALRTAWRERRDGVAAHERASDAATQAVPVVVDDATEVIEAIPTTTDRPRSRRARRLVPILAFAVLATLAGTSVYIGEERGAAPGDATSEEASTTDDTAADQRGELAEAPTADEIASDGGFDDTTGDGGFDPTTEDGGFDAAASGAGAGPIEGDPTASVPPVEPGAPADVTADLAIESDAPTETERSAIDAVDPTDPELTCVATRDEAELVLPDGRLPQRIVRGPLGIFVVCG